MNVQIAEDNPNHLSDMVELVEQTCPGAQIIRTPTYELALIAAGTGPDVLIIDARLSGDDPGMVWEGYAVAAQARAANPAVEVILISALFQGVRLSAEGFPFRIVEKTPGWLDRLESICHELSRTARPPTVFLSYARIDKDTVQPLYDELRANGVAPWWDFDLKPGERWAETIRARIRDSDFFMACVGRTYTGREGSIQKELRWALDRADEKPPGYVYIIPARLAPESEMPERLSEYQFVDLFRVNGMRHLLEVLKAPRGG